MAGHSSQDPLKRPFFQSRCFRFHEQSRWKVALSSATFQAPFLHVLGTQTSPKHEGVLRLMRSTVTARGGGWSTPALAAWLCWREQDRGSLGATCEDSRGSGKRRCRWVEDTFMQSWKIYKMVPGLTQKM